MSLISKDLKVDSVIRTKRRVILGPKSWPANTQFAVTALTDEIVQLAVAGRDNEWTVNRMELDDSSFILIG